MEIPRETIVVQVNPIIGDIVDSYLELSNKNVDSLLNALNRGDFDRIKHLAHDLVGTGGSFGLEDISLIGRSLENAAENRETEEIRLLVDDLVEYLSLVEIVY